VLSLLTAAVILFCLAMGLVALAAPERISAINGTPTLTVAGRNEIRAVYGGFGVVIAGMLCWGLADHAMRAGVLLTVGAAFAGMAFGRLAAAVIERPERFYPSWFYCVLELAMAGVLWGAARG
jgi:hypothetical protein